MKADRSYEIRDPIYGFITVDDWEREIINHPVFQRLRRIKQLAWTEMVYPGANHTRFEHSLGVCHLAGKAYDILINKNEYQDRLRSSLAYGEDGIKRDRRVVRLAALLHDIGHAPFSHAAEALMPVDPEKQKRGKSGPDAKFTHEQYSAAIIREFFKDVINGYPENSRNWHITADEVARLLEEPSPLEERLFWRNIISSQMDVDRMDYLLRDSYHCGVRYGHYDLDRLLGTLAITYLQPEDPDADGELTIGVEEGGSHAAEQLILARYSMFTQVYFHRVRRAYDHHLEQVLQKVVKEFPPPTGNKSLEKYIAWDDWCVLGYIASDKAGEHGIRIKNRDHYREAHHTKEVPDLEDMDLLQSIRDGLGDLIKYADSADKSWYKLDRSDIIVEREDGTQAPLSRICPVVRGLPGVKQYRLYSAKKDMDTVKKRKIAIMASLGKGV